MIDKLNAFDLPDKYEYITSEDGALMGISYVGKKEEIILEPEYIEATVFKSLGRVCLIFKEPGSDTYTLVNKKKTEKVEGIYDFVASPSIFYIQVQGEFNRENLEWCVLNKDFERAKNLGVFTLTDPSTSNGNRVLSSTQKNLEILDRHEKTCRITLKDSSIDEVITFGNKKKATNDKHHESSSYRLEFNLTNGRVKMVGNLGDDVRINTFTNLDKNKSFIINLLNTEIVEDTVTVRVKRHDETYNMVYANIKSDIALKISKFLSRFEENTDFDVISTLLSKKTTGDLMDNFENGFTDIESVEGLSGINAYAIKCINTRNSLLTLVLNRTNGKVIYDWCDKDNTLLWNEDGDFDISIKIKNKGISKIDRDLEEYERKALKYPLIIVKRRTPTGEAIENERYETEITCICDICFDIGSKTYHNEFGIIISDGFRYDIKKIRSRKDADLNKYELHDRVYNPDNIVLTSRTGYSSVFTVLKQMEPDIEEVIED